MVDAANCLRPHWKRVFNTPLRIYARTSGTRIRLTSQFARKYMRWGTCVSRGQTRVRTLYPAVSPPSQTVRTEPRPCPAQPARPPGYQALLPPHPKGPEATTKATCKFSSAAASASNPHRKRMDSTAAAGATGCDARKMLQLSLAQGARRRKPSLA